MPLTPGYNRSEIAKMARQIDARAEREDYEAWQSYAAEARACGYEVTPFREWRGDEPDAKAKASERMANIPSYMLDLY